MNRPYYRTAPYCTPRADLIAHLNAEHPAAGPCRTYSNESFWTLGRLTSWHETQHINEREATG